MLRKKISAGVAILIAAQLIAVACYVSNSSTQRTCPNRASRGSASCSLDIGSTYPWVVTDTTGYTDAKSDGTPHCHYHCPNGSGFWSFPGAVTTGASCGQGG